jgi:glycerol-3-phosphate dehydrogenase (NAD(P)+)
MNVAILGAGAWGSALAIALSERHRIHLWARSAGLRDALRRHRRSDYLPEVPLPDSVRIEDDAPACIAQADLVLIATPTAGLREMLRLCSPQSGESKPLVWACKGFEPASSLLPHQIAMQELGDNTAFGALSGPSFALEVAQGKPTALTFAATEAAFAQRMALALHQTRLRVYSSTDLVGVEVGGAVKNVMAIATGICDGLNLGLNARAALITRGLAELMRLGIALGGQAETFTGLTGVGDLILTCTGDLSRNRRVGLALGQGQSLDDILSRLGHVAEGVNTAREVQRRAQQLNIEMPITRAVCAMLFDAMPARDAVEQLLARDPKSENEAARC